MCNFQELTCDWLFNICCQCRCRRFWTTERISYRACFGFRCQTQGCRRRRTATLTASWIWNISQRWRWLRQWPKRIAIQVRRTKNTNHSDDENAVTRVRQQHLPSHDLVQGFHQIGCLCLGLDLVLLYCRLYQNLMSAVILQNSDCEWRGQHYDSRCW